MAIDMRLSSTLAEKSTSTQLTLFSSVVVCGYICYCLLIGADLLYFSPLKRYPGPTLWIIFPIFRYLAMLRGITERDLLKLHNQYGSVIRIGPQELSYNSAQAWQDIYGHGHKQLPKAVFFHDKGRPDHLIAASIGDHSRFRKVMTAGFSEKAVRKQEALMKVYIDAFIQKLRKIGQNDEKVDLMKWFNLVTFDLIGDLAFGEPFGGVSTTEEHDFVRTLFLFIKTGSWLYFFNQYPLLEAIILQLMPKSLTENYNRQWKFAEDVSLRRVNNKAQQGRGDFLDPMVESRNTPGGMTDQEIIVNANILISAGADTSATTLAGTIYYLLTDIDKLDRVQREVRSAFASEEDITFITSSSKVPYMVACLTEAMRIYPPVPTTLPRITPEGPPTPICGTHVPAETTVGVNQYATSWSTSNFYKPERYAPERWLLEINKDPNSEYYNDKRDAVQPFSVGPRNCIGRNLAYAETRTIMARLLYNFDIELCDMSKGWVDQKIWFWWDKKPMWVRLHPRDTRGQR